jgi:PAP2 superfamily
MTGLTTTATPAAPVLSETDRLAGGRSRRQLRWWREVLLIGAWYGGYEGVRAASPTQVGAAHRHAERLLGFERWAHLDPERTLNRLVSGSSELGVLAGCYYAILHFAVTIIALVWLYRRHRALYRQARTVLVTASTASLLVFWFYPVAPPRLAMHGLEDTVVTHNVLGAGHAASTGTFVDLYAALPSLHVGWAFWVAATIVRAHATARYRHLAWLYPMTTALVVLATANHYLVDAAAGVTVIALAELAHLRRARPRASVDHRDRTSTPSYPRRQAMSDANGTGRPPLGIRLLHALGKEPDWSAMTPRISAGLDEDGDQGVGTAAGRMTGRSASTHQPTQIRRVRPG